MFNVRRDLISINSAELVSTLLAKQSFVRSKSVVESFFLDGRVELNGLVISKDQMVCLDDSLYLLTPQSFEPKVMTDYKIVFEDDFLLVVDKPALLPIHPTGKYYFNSLTSLIKRDKPDLNLHTVHRLDRETSGLVIFAKSKEIAKLMFKLFKSNLVNKNYLAIVHGVPKKSGEIVCPLIGSSYGTIRDAVLPTSVGRIAKTSFSLKTCSKNKLFSLLEVIPLTGKKHQIRVHLATSGFPIVGDKQYGFHPERFSDYICGNLSKDNILKYWISNHHLLQCNEISFKHPKTDKLMVISTSISKDMLYFMNEHCFDLS